MRILQLLVEALLYYLACSLVARSREEAPGLIRVLLVVIVLTFISGGVKSVIGDFWLSSAIVFLVNFFVLWIGLGIGFFRTIIAALLVILLRSILTAVFANNPGIWT
ncbi:hypothetical protein EHM69_09285 [candidate division KSB1 bacterium]|nr:MAG: hypothetical protein EHM69_09285 [candidate division KSB1 bacterium]